MGNLPTFEQYLHHDRIVIVRRSLKGKHQEHCLCWSCLFFNPEDRKQNCPIANKLYALCVKEGLVTPVWECPRFYDAKEPIGSHSWGCEECRDGFTAIPVIGGVGCACECHVDEPVKRRRG